MKTKNRNKNDRAAFFYLSSEEYAALSKANRKKWRKPEVFLGTLADLFPGNPTVSP